MGNEYILQHFSSAVLRVQDVGTAYLIDSERGYLLTAGHVLWLVVRNGHGKKRRGSPGDSRSRKFQKDDPFGHPLFSYLPDGDLTGLVLDFDVTWQGIQYGPSLREPQG